MPNVYPNLEIAGNKIVYAAGRKLAKLSEFAHDYSNSPAEAGAIVDIPMVATVAGVYNDESNNYGSQEGTFGVAKINVDDHLVAGFTVTQKQISDGLGAWSDTFARLGEASGRAIAKKVEEDVFSDLSAAELTATVAVPTTKSTFIDLWKNVAEADMDNSECVLVMDAPLYAKCLDAVQGTVTNLQKAIEDGYIDNFLGFKRVISTNALPDGVRGAILGPNAIGLANRTLEFDAEAYTSVQQFVDADSGIACTMVVFTDPNTGKKKISATALFGHGIVRKEEVLLIKGA